MAMRHFRHGLLNEFSFANLKVWVTLSILLFYISTAPPNWGTCLLIPQSGCSNCMSSGGAKESLYKAYGRRQLDFCQHMAVSPVKPGPKTGEVQGLLSKGPYRQEFRVVYRAVEAYVLVYAVAAPDKS